MGPKSKAVSQRAAVAPTTSHAATGSNSSSVTAVDASKRTSGSDEDLTASTSSPVTAGSEIASSATEVAIPPKRGRWITYLMVLSPRISPESRDPSTANEIAQRNPDKIDLKGWCCTINHVIAVNSLQPSFGWTLYKHLLETEADHFMAETGEDIVTRIINNGAYEHGTLNITQRGGYPTFAAVHTNNNVRAGLMTIVQATSVSHRLKLRGQVPFGEMPWDERNGPAPNLLHASDMLFLNWVKACRHDAKSATPHVRSEAQFYNNMSQLRWILLKPIQQAPILNNETLKALWMASTGRELKGEFPLDKVLSFDLVDTAFQEILMEVPIIRAVAFMLVQYRRHFRQMLVSTIYVVRDQNSYGSLPLVLLKVIAVSVGAMDFIERVHWKKDDAMMSAVRESLRGSN